MKSYKELQAELQAILAADAAELDDDIDLDFDFDFDNPEEPPVPTLNFEWPED